MNPDPFFSFFIPGEDDRISPDSSLWRMPLSGNSSDFLKNVQNADTAKKSALTIGDYFTAARIFLENDHRLESALCAMTDKGWEDLSIKEVELSLEKHGAFYHPIRVRVMSKRGCSVLLVLNGAVSRPGLSLIKKEYQLLTRLERHAATVYTPRVFAAAIQPFEIGNPGDAAPENSSLAKVRMGFLLGEWFEGFREFHVSTLGGERQIAVWASNGNIDFLSLERASVIYEQIAYILTSYYNVDTGEQIIAWHHAAGDFVVNPLAEEFQVKLITVRGYETLMEFDPGAGPGEMILPSLLFFFLNLTLRMQIDRLDGTGPVAFIGKQVLQATVKGFLRGLDDKTEHSLTPGGAKLTAGLRELFVDFMTGLSLEQIEGGLANLIETWPEALSERAMASSQINSHSALVNSLFKNM